MQTLPTDEAQVVEIGRPAYRPFRVRVGRVERLTPSFRQVTFTGPDLTEFGDDGLDQRIKLILPDGPRLPADLAADDGGASWYAQWLAMPESIRPAMRTYTVRRARPWDAAVDVVLVDHDTGHGPPGPAVRWLRNAGPGDEIVLVGPDARSPDRHQGIDWRPGAARRLLLAGDETAAPAIVAILESLAGDVDGVDGGVTARAFVEVPDDRDRLPADLPDHTRIHWLPRGGGTHGELLGPAVADWLDGHARLLDAVRALGAQRLDDIDVDQELLWDTPDPTGEAFYAWMAGEAAAIKALRRAVVTDRGVDRRQVAFMGYWRQGQAERS
ncbi:MAG TPA: siderophore-interacting protein [Nakamurella sp.]